MKIYTSLTLDMKSGAVLGEKFYDYEGPITECKGGKAGDGGAAEAARAQEAARQAAIRDGTQKIDNMFNTQFTDDFYNGRRDSYLNYATPQLEDQYQDAQKQLAYFLDRNSTLDSSIRAGKEAELQKAYDTNRRAVSDQALDYSNKARTNVEDARANLISTLSATGDSQGAVNSAISRSASLSAPDAYSPLGDLFTKFTGLLNNQAGLERGAALTGGMIKPAFNTGLFAPNPSAVRNTP